MNFLENKISLIVSFVSVFLIVIFLSNKGILHAIIVFGQGHFLVSYYFRKKYRGFSKNYLLLFLFWITFLTAICSFILFHPEWFNFFILITISLFIVHYFNDELKMHGLVLRNKILGTVAVFLSFLGLFLTKLYDINTFYVSILFFTAAILGFLFIRSLMSGTDNLTKEKRVIILFSLAHILGPIVLSSQEGISFYQISGFIILAHYLRWYLFYYMKLKDKELSHFIDSSLVINFLVLIAFIAYTLSPLFSFLFVIFNPIFFYGWTILHIMLSIRKEDYSFIFR